MPTYEYHCDSCAENFDAVQSFHDDPLTSCPTCGSPVRKVFGNVGIVFKGSGFYKTDSRSGGKAKATTETSPGTSGSEGSGSDGSGSDGSGSESAPATPPAKTSGDGAKPDKASDSNSSSPPTKAPAAAGSTSSKDSGS